MMTVFCCSKHFRAVCAFYCYRYFIAWSLVLVNCTTMTALIELASGMPVTCDVGGTALTAVQQTLHCLSGFFHCTEGIVNHESF